MPCFSTPLGHGSVLSVHRGGDEHSDGSQTWPKTDPPAASTWRDLGGGRPHRRANSLPQRIWQGNFSPIYADSAGSDLIDRGFPMICDKFPTHGGQRIFLAGAGNLFAPRREFVGRARELADSFIGSSRRTL